MRRCSNPPGGAAEPPSGVEAYGNLLKEELEAQDKRKASFEQRGLAVITTSGTLVTLLFALAALSTKGQTFVLPDAARGWLLGSLPFFVLAALAAVITNIPVKYQIVTAEAIRERLKEKPIRNADEAAKDIALTRVKALKSAKKINSIKGWVLVTGMALEVIAVGCVAIAIWHIL
jgi:flagellar biosynthesis protein FlhB